MQQIRDAGQNKKTPKFGRLLICNNYMVHLEGLSSNLPDEKSRVQGDLQWREHVRKYHTIKYDIRIDNDPPDGPQAIKILAWIIYYDWAKGILGEDYSG